MVIGAGLAGTCAAFVLARSGFSVVLIDRHAVYPQEFRAEKMGESKMAIFERLGLGPAVRKFVTPMDDLWVYHFGQLYSRKQVREYGFHYPALINGLRSSLPPEVRLVTGKVEAIETSAERQRVQLTSGLTFDCRLIVVATGLGETIRRSLQIQRIETSKAHSLSLGFTLARTARSFPFQGLTYYGRSWPGQVCLSDVISSRGEHAGQSFCVRRAGRFLDENVSSLPTRHVGKNNAGNSGAVRRL